MYEPVFITSYDTDKNIKVELSTEVQGLDIHYSFDESHPDQFYPKYKAPLTIPKDAAHLKLVTYRDGKPAGRQINMPVEELKKRAERNKK